ncbi:hypothetical protein ACFL4T_12745 [candidate division KSB1 bacterium]
MQITLLDHHKNADASFIDNPKVEITFGNEESDYYLNLKDKVNTDYDLVLFEQNVDAVISTIVYYLNTKKEPDIECIYKHISKDKFQKYIDDKKKNIFALNTLKIYGSDLEDIEKIYLLNPHETGLANISISHILYKSVDNPSPFIRDLVGLAIAADYTMENCLDTMLEIIKSYKDIFPCLFDRIQDLSLNKFNLLDSKLGELTRMFWSPVMLEGDEGAYKLINNILSSNEFNYHDLFKTCDNPAVNFIKESYEKFSEILNREKSRFNEQKIVDGKIFIYEPEYQSENFIREFSNIIKDENLFNIIVMKVKKDDGATKYSIRRGKLDVDIGGVLHQMEAGGGNPFAGGGTVANEEKFESEFKKHINRILPD